jgi:hypothetical protein
MEMFANFHNTRSISLRVNMLLEVLVNLPLPFGEMHVVSSFGFLSKNDENFAMAYQSAGNLLLKAVIALCLDL